jgi:hypothetical protein
VSRAQVVEALEAVLRPGTEANWRGARAARNLPKDLAPAFARRVFAKLLRDGEAIRTFGATLSDAYVPLVREVLAAQKTCDAVFLSSLPRTAEGAEFRRMVKALVGLGFEASGKRTALVKSLVAQPDVVAAAQATVAAKGFDAWLFIQLLIADGSPESADVLMPLWQQALKKKGEELSLLSGMLEEGTSPAMRAMLASSTSAIDARAATSLVGELAERFGGTRADFVFHLGLQTVEQAHGDGKLKMSFLLGSRASPQADIFGTRATRTLNAERFKWADGKTLENEARFPTLASLDELPAWLARVAKDARCTWNPQPRWVKNSLRGKARAGLIAWLLGG